MANIKFESRIASFQKKRRSQHHLTCGDHTFSRFFRSGICCESTKKTSLYASFNKKNMKIFVSSLMIACNKDESKQTLFQAQVPHYHQRKLGNALPIHGYMLLQS